MEAVFAAYFLLILRLVYLSKVDTLCFGIGCYQILAVLYILLLELTSEPLVDLVLGLCALYDLEPVTAWSLGVLRGDYLYLVTVFDDIVYRHELAVYLGTDHLVADRRVYAVGKVYRCGALWQVLYIAGRCECKYIVGE